MTRQDSCQRQVNDYGQRQEWTTVGTYSRATQPLLPMTHVNDSIDMGQRVECQRLFSTTVVNGSCN